MFESIIVLLGGRAAEKIKLNDISTGASNDIERATKIARQMVTKFGMSDKIGPINLGSDHDESVSGAISLAKEIGILLSKDDFEVPEGEVSDAELGTVSGGINVTPKDVVDGYCFCLAAGGGGGKEEKDHDVFGCACVAYGQGGDAKNDHWLCQCYLGGSGGSGC